MTQCISHGTLKPNHMHSLAFCAHYHFTIKYNSCWIYIFALTLGFVFYLYFYFFFVALPLYSPSRLLSSIHRVHWLQLLRLISYMRSHTHSVYGVVVLLHLNCAVKLEPTCTRAHITCTALCVHIFVFYRFFYVLWWLFGWRWMIKTSVIAFDL